MRPIDSSELRGRRVIDNQGHGLGEVADVSIEPDSWRVRGLIVEIDRDVADDLHVDKPLFTGRPKMEFSTDRIDALGDNIILNMDRDQIAGVLRRGGE